MSDNLPDEIQLEIMKRLPVKSLIRFRIVSKAWKSHINSSDFIIKHFSYHRMHSQHLLVKYKNIHLADCDDKYVLIVDDDTFPKQKMLEDPAVIGTSHGLVCLHGRKRDVIFLWNILIRKVVVVVPPNANEHIFRTVLGFGVCRETNDPKIVRITFVDDRTMMQEGIGRVDKVEVFTLSTRAWRSSYGNLPRKSIQFYSFHDGAVIDGVYYWLAKERIAMDYDHQYIISFDMASKEFKEVTLPRSLIFVSMSKLEESLIVVGPDRHTSHLGYNVWTMGDENTSISGIPNSGDPIVEVPEGYDHGKLVVYKPYLKRITNLGIEGSHKSFELYDYMETLLLVDKPNFMAYNDIS
ncbi:putative F-box protein At3g16210 [Bidens hawaiensis]|uniref:putative F-box protein At3g16210 n=1 Tax=Bidens hawaiensis TaxID=980011 RepID=UPI00404B3524